MKDNQTNYKEPLEVKVKKVGKRYHVSLFHNGALHSSSACELKCDIGYVSRDLMRWYDKLGGRSRWAKSARRRHNEDYDRGCKDRVWFYTHRYAEKSKT